MGKFLRCDLTCLWTTSNEFIEPARVGQISTIKLRGCSFVALMEALCLFCTEGEQDQCLSRGSFLRMSEPTVKKEKSMFVGGIDEGRMSQDRLQAKTEAKISEQVIKLFKYAIQIINYN